LTEAIIDWENFITEISAAFPVIVQDELKVWIDEEYQEIHRKVK
jgi:hypothetical protein